MSIRVASQVWTLNLPPNDKFVLVALADHADEQGLCYPSVARIAWKCGLDRRRVQRSLTRLRSMNIIQAVAYGRGGRGRATIYRVTPENGPPLPQFSSLNSVNDTALSSTKGDIDTAVSREKGGSSEHKRAVPVTQKGGTSDAPIIMNHQEPSDCASRVAPPFRPSPWEGDGQNRKTVSTTSPWMPEQRPDEKAFWQMAKIYQQTFGGEIGPQHFNDKQYSALRRQLTANDLDLKQVVAEFAAAATACFRNGNLPSRKPESARFLYLLRERRQLAAGADGRGGIET